MNKLILFLLTLILYAPSSLFSAAPKDKPKKFPWLYRIATKNRKLAKAIDQGWADKAENLLKQGANPNTSSYSDSSPVLMSAVMNNDLSCVELLLRYKADPTFTRETFPPTTIVAAAHASRYTQNLSNTLKIIHLLMQHGCTNASILATANGYRGAFYTNPSYNEVCQALLSYLNPDEIESVYPDQIYTALVKRSILVRNHTARYYAQEIQKAMKEKKLQKAARLETEHHREIEKIVKKINARMIQIKKELFAAAEKVRAAKLDAENQACNEAVAQATDYSYYNSDESYYYSYSDTE